MIQTEILNKQRILFVGDDAQKLAELSEEILEKIQKPLGSVSLEADTVAVFLTDTNIEHHILVVGEAENQLDELKQLADRTPKSGSIIYNKDIKEIAKICKEKREDVQTLEFKSKEEFGAVKTLLTNRLRIQEDTFDQAVKEL